jgi:phospholipid:diacylglycerol acyltransferase
MTLAPSMKIYCMYGVGLPTERSYYYTKATEDIKHNDECPTADCEIDVSKLLNGTNIKEEEFMHAVVKKSIQDSSNSESMSQPPPIVGILATRSLCFD